MLRRLTGMFSGSRFTREQVKPKWLHVLLPVTETVKVTTTHQLVEKLQVQINRIEQQIETRIESRFDKLDATLKTMMEKT